MVFILSIGVVRAQEIILTGPANNLYNTGYNGTTFDSRPAPMTPNYTPLPDSHYAVVAIFNSPVDIPSPTFLSTPQSSYQAYSQSTASELAGGWNTTGLSQATPGQWISFGSTLTTSGANPTNYAGGTNVVYDYRLNLTNLPLGYKLTVTGVTTSDNALLVTANGNTKSFFANQTSVDNNPNSYTTPASLNISFLTLASNYIDFNVLNDSTGGPTGLQVYGLAGTAIPLAQAVDYATLISILQSGIYSPAEILELINSGVLPSLQSGFFKTGDLTNLLNSGALPAAVLAPSFSLPLTPNGRAVATALNLINSSGTTTPAFVSLGLSLLDVASVSDPYAYDAALRSLSPEALGILATDGFNNDSFMTLDMDDYLAHRRAGSGDLQVCAGGVDTTGLRVSDPAMDPNLNRIQSRLDSHPPGQGEAALQQPNKNLDDDCDCRDRINFFIRGDFILSQNFSDTDLAHTDGTTSSCVTGADYQFGRHWLAGVLFSYDHTDTDLDENGGDATIDGYAPGLYASYANGGWYANALATFRFNSYSTNRVIKFDTINSTANASPTGTEEMVYEDGGYEFHQDGWIYGPMIGLMYNHIDVGSYEENGAGVADLTVHNQDAESVRSRIGVRISRIFKSGDMWFTPHFNATWQHEFLDDSRGISSSFSSAPPNSFTVYTPSPSRDAALLEVGLDADLRRDITAFLYYQVQAGQSNYFGQSLEGGVKLAF